MSKNHSKIEKIAGDYQYKALRLGNIVQRQWHKNRHNLIYFLKFLTKSDLVLDAGCGSGNVLFEFSPSVKEITGIDNNNDCINFIKNTYKKNKIKNIKVKKTNLLRIELPQKYSKVILTEVIEHFDQKDTKKLLSNLKKTMKKNGKILVTTPNYWSLWIIIEKIIDIFHLTPALWGEQHLIQFTPQILKKTLESEGFIVERIGTLNFVSPFISIISPKLADKVSQFEFSYVPFGSLIYAVAIKE